MANNVNPIPEAYRSATPYLSVRDATDAIKFYQRAFGAREVFQMSQPDGKIGHAELRIGEAPIDACQSSQCCVDMPDGLLPSRPSLCR
jgi:uncharacterized glyoxalase superfamily protein PhnB